MYRRIFCREDYLVKRNILKRRISCKKAKFVKSKLFRNVVERISCRARCFVKRDIVEIREIKHLQ